MENGNGFVIKKCILMRHFKILYDSKEILGICTVTITVLQIENVNWF